MNATTRSYAIDHVLDHVLDHAPEHVLDTPLHLGRHGVLDTPTHTRHGVSDLPTHGRHGGERERASFDVQRERLSFEAQRERASSFHVFRDRCHSFGGTKREVERNRTASFDSPPKVVRFLTLNHRYPLLYFLFQYFTSNVISVVIS